jgi:hypothetical protein
MMHMPGKIGKRGLQLGQSLGVCQTGTRSRSFVIAAHCRSYLFAGITPLNWSSVETARFQVVYTRNKPIKQDLITKNKAINCNNYFCFFLNFVSNSAHFTSKNCEFSFGPCFLRSAMFRCALQPESLDDYEHVQRFRERDECWGGTRRDN